MVGVGGRQLFSKLEGIGPPTRSIYLPGSQSEWNPNLDGLCVYQRL